MLHYAAVRDSTAVVKALLDGGANIEAVTNQGMTAMHLAARSGRTAVLRTLAEHGAQTTPFDNEKATPLCVAIQYCQATAAVALLKLGVKPDLDKIHNITPVESEGETAWKNTQQALQSTLSLMHSNRLKQMRIQLYRRAQGAVTP